MFNETISNTYNIRIDLWNVSIIWTTLLTYFWMGSQNPNYVRKLIKYYESKAESSEESSPFWKRLFQFNRVDLKDDESDTEDLITAIAKKESNTQTEDITTVTQTERSINYGGDTKFEKRVDGWRNFFDFQNILAIVVILVGILYIAYNRRLEMEKENRGIIVRAVLKLLESFRNVYNFFNKKLKLFEI